MGGLGAWVAEAKKEAGPDEFLRNSSDSASCFLCSFSLGHLDESGWDENICLLKLNRSRRFPCAVIEYAVNMRYFVDNTT